MVDEMVEFYHLIISSHLTIYHLNQVMISSDDGMIKEINCGEHTGER